MVHLRSMAYFRWCFKIWGRRVRLKAIGMITHRNTIASSVLLPGCSFQNRVSLTAEDLRMSALIFLKPWWTYIYKIIRGIYARIDEVQRRWPRVSAIAILLIFKIQFCS